LSATAPPYDQHETVAEILAWFDEKPTIARRTQAARRIDGLQDLGTSTLRSLRCVVIRNYTIEPLGAYLTIEAARAGLHLAVGYSSYDPSIEELDELLGAAPDLVVLALRLEAMSSALTRDLLANEPAAVEALAEAVVDRIDVLVQGVRARCNAMIAVHNFVLPTAVAGGLADTQNPVGRLNVARAMNVHLVAKVRQTGGASVLDVDHLFASLGYQDCYDARGDRTSAAPLSPIALEALATAQLRNLNAARGPLVKCVVVDCDNTLWGGVIGEDGLAGIALGDSGPGRRHQDLQYELVNLRRRGIALAIASKNEVADVIEVLTSHPESVLRPGDFAAMHVNWEDKADNIAAIAAELNISTGHMAFIDDDRFQCEWVAERLPDVRVVHWPDDLEPSGSLEDLAWFDSLVITDEDRQRTTMYRAEAQRRTTRDEAMTPEEYLRSLELVATVGTAADQHLPRVAQLTQRTNQFNLTTRRYDMAELAALSDDPGAAIVWLDLRDRFGSYGMVGCGIVRRDHDEAVIDTLLVSCRVLGRSAEMVLVDQLARISRAAGATVLVGEYVPSERNGQVADLYDRIGFSVVDTDGARRQWKWDLTAGRPGVPDWIQVIEESDGSRE